MPDLDARMQRWRRELHGIPETAFEEHATGAYVGDVLESLGWQVTRGIGGTGVVGSLSRGTCRRAVGLRADLDALPITEVDGREHGSTRPGRMHACGHDGHMAMVLGAAAVLAADESLDGTVRVVFQPAEEPGRGAQALLDDGLFERFPIDVLHGLHNLPGVPTGHLHTRAGGIMAGEDDFEIVVTGRGGHSARPQAVVDPLVVGAEVVLALQSTVARTIDPLAPAVLSCTGFHTDGARNAIPGTVVISGDTRSFDPEVRRLLERRIRETAHGIAAAHGAMCSVTYTHEFAPTVNDPVRALVAADAATAVLGAHHVDGDCSPIMPSEDFGLYAAHVPSCFSLLGNGTTDEAGGMPLHSSSYDFNDAALPSGVAFFAEVVRRELQRSD